MLAKRDDIKCLKIRKSIFFKDFSSKIYRLLLFDEAGLVVHPSAVELSFVVIAA